MKTTVTRQFKELLLGDIKSRVAEDTYVLYSSHHPWSSYETASFTDPPADVSLNHELESVETWRNSHWAKRISQDDVAYLVRKYEWAQSADKIIPYYKFDAVTTPDKTYYVSVDRYNFFKCIDAPAGVASTVEPNLLITDVFETADGFKWKYMFTITPTEYIKFQIGETFVPMSSNTTVEEAAVGGTLDAINVDTSGNNWTAHHVGEITQAVSPSVFRISNDAVTSNDYYTLSGFYVTAGPGSGYYSQITDYTSNSSGNFVTVESANTLVGFGADYSISPFVKIDGDGAGAIAYSVSNTSADTVDSVKMLSYGNGYSWATATLVSRDGQSNTLANLSTAVGPLYGHGARPVSELQSNNVMISLASSGPGFDMRGAMVRRIAIASKPKQSNNDVIATESEYRQAYLANVTSIPGLDYSYSIDEVMTGQTSGARATVIGLGFNTQNVFLSNTVSSFVGGEVVSFSKGGQGRLNTIAGPELKPYSGNVLYISNINQISASPLNGGVIVKMIVGLTGTVNYTVEAGVPPFAIDRDSTGGL